MQIDSKITLKSRQELGVGTIIHIFKNDAQIDLYIVKFNTYIEKPQFRSQIQPYIYPPQTKIKYSQNRVGTIIAAKGKNESNHEMYEILTLEGKQIRVSEREIVEEIKDPLSAFVVSETIPQNIFLLKLWARQFQNLYQSNTLKIISNSRLILMPHQLSVATQLLNQGGNARYILSDEVGLGKTIEAGIYIKEMISRKMARRILIIPPAALSEQWEFEMRNKFHLKFTKIDSNILNQSKISINSGNLKNTKTNEEYELCLINLQYARFSRVADQISQIRWDIVIFDEAHHCRRYLENQKTRKYRSTLAYKLAEKLSKNTQSLLLLTATPIQLHSFDLFSLIALLNPYLYQNFEDFEYDRMRLSQHNLIIKNILNYTRLSVFESQGIIHQIMSLNLGYTSETVVEELVKDRTKRLTIIEKIVDNHFLSKYVIRNRRRKVFPESKIRRIAKIINVTLTEKELAIYNKIHLYLANIYSENYSSAPKGMGFVIVILQKLLTSSNAAIIKTLTKRIHYLEENKDLLLSLREEEKALEFYEDESSLDYSMGLDELDFEDRMVVKKRKRKMQPKNEKTLDINEHITVLKDFLTDLKSLDIDTKVEELVKVVQRILREDPTEKIIIFTQFKQTLFFIANKLKNTKVEEFHGDLTEKQKIDAVERFRDESNILLSTEIGGEGRNFQFCHIIINYDLPWNPMRLEQRIGRVDRIGQTKNVLIYNFFTEGTVESNIIRAIDERIHIFEESIGALEPILGNLEKSVKDVILKRSAIPTKFVLDELITKTTEKVESVEAQLEDMILDKKSFQYTNLSKNILKNIPLSSIDLITFLKLLHHESHDFTMKTLPHHKDNGMWQLSYSSDLRKKLRLTKKTYIGTFDLDLAIKYEEHDFFALGNENINQILSYIQKENPNSLSSHINLDKNKIQQLFKPPNAARLSSEENIALKSCLEENKQMYLFIFEIQYIGILMEKQLVFIFISEDGTILPSFNKIFARPHNLQLVTYRGKENYNRNQNTQSKDQLQDFYKSALHYTKSTIQNKANKIAERNRKEYKFKLKQTKKLGRLKKQYFKAQISELSLEIKAKILKRPTEKQKENIKELPDGMKKKKRLQYVENLENEIKRLENEKSKIYHNLEELSFDVPSTIKRLKHYKQLKIDAEFIAIAQIHFI